MKLPGLSALTPLGAALAAAAVAAVVAVALWFITEPGRERAKAAQARAEAIQAGAQAAAGRDAVDVVIKNGEAQQATDRQTMENRDAILSAPGAQAPVDPGVGAAGRRGICLRQSARRLPECQPVQPARP